MCGICGLVEWDTPLGEEARQSISRMVSLLHHRGPDAQGIDAFGSALLGHTRLSIIDLSDAGRQPMTNEDGSIAIVFNGEIYNFAGLRDELLKLGHSFRSRTDTEVLIHGYEEWGLKKLLDRCDGMWAFALWDRTQQKLILSRDRFGEKPLFYKRTPSGIHFASTLQSLLAAHTDNPKYRPAVVGEYLACGFVPPDSCIFEGVEKVAPGAVVELSAKQTITSSYWTLRYQAVDQSPDEAECELERVLDRAVQTRLVADVPVGAFLSGGIDSSLVVALMSRHNARPKTFTMRVPGTYRDEGEYAAAVAKKYKTEHIEIKLDESCVSSLPELVVHLGEPFADCSIIPAQFVCREIRRYVTVVLGGDGGDESFGGYRGVPYLHFMQRMNGLGFDALRRFAPRLRMLAQGGENGVHKALRALAYAASFSEYMKDLPYIGTRQLSRLAGPKLKQLDTAIWEEPFRRALARAEAEQWHERHLAIGFNLVLAGDFMTKVDTAAMAHSVEARSPFLARSVVEFASRLPASLIANHETDKVLLKSLARKLLPVTCVDRQKAGFSVPTEKYIEGPWKPLVKDLLLDGTAVQEGLLDGTGVRELVNKDPAFRYRGAGLVFTMLCLELWLRLVVHRTSNAQEMTSTICRYL